MLVECSEMKRGSCWSRCGGKVLTFGSWLGTHGKRFSHEPVPQAAHRRVREPRITAKALLTSFHFISFQFISFDLICL